MQSPDLSVLSTQVAGWLSWHAKMGVDVTFGPRDLLHGLDDNHNLVELGAQHELKVSAVRAVPTSIRAGGVSAGHQLAASCATIQELQASLQTFEGCGLKRTANKLCFGDGNPQARIFVVGEAPGSEEDRMGKPFVGASGQLLDRMLGSTGLNRETVWISNLIFWRPPGNRTPSADEIAVCQPFLERQIELIAPEILLFVGGTAAKALLGVKEGVTKLRGRQSLYSYGDGRQARCLVTFHPAFLLRQPLQKKFAWRDMLSLSSMIESMPDAPVHR